MTLTLLGRMQTLVSCVTGRSVILHSNPVLRPSWHQRMLGHIICSTSLRVIQLALLYIAGTLKPSVLKVQKGTICNYVRPQEQWQKNENGPGWQNYGIMEIVSMCKWTWQNTLRKSSTVNFWCWKFMMYLFLILRFCFKQKQYPFHTVNLNISALWSNTVPYWRICWYNFCPIQSEIYVNLWIHESLFQKCVILVVKPTIL